MDLQDRSSREEVEYGMAEERIEGCLVASSRNMSQLTTMGLSSKTMTQSTLMSPPLNDKKN